MMPPVLRSLLSLPVCMFCCLVATALHPYANSGGAAVPTLAAWLASYFLASSVAQWVLRDVWRRHHAPCYDFGSFVFFAWPVVAPAYLLRTYDWRGLLPVGGFALLYLAACAVGWLAWLQTSHG